MRKRHRRISLVWIVFLVFLGSLFQMQDAHGDEKQTVVIAHHEKRVMDVNSYSVSDDMARFHFYSGLNFTYPDAVRGIYVTGPVAGGSRFESVLNLVETTDLNAMVIDIKDDNGNLTYKPAEDSPFYSIGLNYIKDPRQLLEFLEEKQIYPIARVVVFKDTYLAETRPDLSFTEKDGSVWKNRRDEAFVSPFMKEVWDYNVQVAIEAAKMGFKEIQFDYVRFPEGFEKRDKILGYSLGDYKALETEDVQKRVQAVTDFVAYAREKLKPYQVDVSVDIFGYSATIKEAPGIGQNFSKIAENVDVISSMIYPSHWTPYFGIPLPDAEPYRLVSEYAKVENAVLAKLDNPPTSRPWLQDFEAPWVYPRGVKVTEYGKEEVEAQIIALNELGINEFLLWNAGNRYTPNVDYTPLNKNDQPN